MQIADKKVVSIDYKLTNDAGDVIDSSEGQEPLDYLHGAGNIIPGLESALVGKKSGDALKVTIEPEDGYGAYDEENTQVVPRSAFEAGQELQVGMQFQAHTDHGVQIVSISAVDGDNITLDGNHPLAGERLHFDVTVRDVRDATAEELEHGHVHTEGCEH